MNTRKCPVCNSAVIGRSDKKYCTDQCRFEANNQHKRGNHIVMLKVNQQLQKNRSILHQLSPFGRTVVNKAILDGLGYDFGTFSSLISTSQKKIYYLCYDYGFTPIYEDGIAKVLIIVREPAVYRWNPWHYVKKNL